ncbi:MAG: DUF7282 domain-containing protein [Geodermatophilaceae bacterium]
MTKTPLLALATAAAALTLAACGENDDSANGPGGIQVTDPGGESSAQPPSSAESSAATTATGGSDDDDRNEVEVSDQSGDGSTVLVDQVRAEKSGFVVIVDDAGTVLGSAPVNAGDTAQLSVPTQIPATGNYEAQLYTDDGNGRFDPAADQPVRNDDDDSDDGSGDDGSGDDDSDDGSGDDGSDDDDDIESDEFDYQVG